MSVKQLPNNLYGFPGPLTPSTFPPIISLRTPKTTDYAPIGAEWIYTPGNEVFFLTSIVSNVATWILVAPSGGVGNFTSLTVNPGLSNLSALTQVGAANINATAANPTNIGNATSTTTMLGTVHINAAGAGVTTIGTGGTGAVNIGNATGNIAATGTFGVTGAINATLTITSSTAAIVGVQVIATGDLGNGFAAETSLTNAINTTQGVGALSILSTTGNPGNNAGFIKIYVGTAIAYIPYWTNIAP